MSSDARRRAMASARYLRAFFVLVFTPLSVYREVFHPDNMHLGLLAATVAQTVAAGWVYRTAVAWWTLGTGQTSKLVDRKRRAVHELGS